MKKLFYILLSGFLVLFAYPLLAEELDEVSVLNNQAQVQKAESLAEASQEAAQKEAMQTQENIEAIESDLLSAQSKLASLKDDPEATQEELDAAQERVDELSTQLDTQLDNLSNISSASIEDISALREDGLGWGEIAHELGVHPSVLGLGHGKKDARSRDEKGFNNYGSQVSAQNSNKNSFGLKGKADEAKGNKGGNSASKGGVGNKGGNSSGKGGGNGNGNGSGKK